MNVYCQNFLQIIAERTKHIAEIGFHLWNVLAVEVALVLKTSPNT